MNNLQLSYTFDALASEVWQALTSAERLEEWTGSPAVIDPLEGSEINLWDGLVTGTVLESLPEQKITLDWQQSDHEFQVEIELTAEDGTTRMDITITSDDPDVNWEAVEQFWEEEIIAPLRSYVEPEV